MMNESLQTVTEADGSALSMLPTSGTAHMPEWLRRRADDMPDRPALIVGEQVWTYAELDAAATRLALHLAGCGIGAGDRVAVLLRNGPHVACAVHALIRLGAVLVPLNLRLGEPELVWQARHAGIRMLIHDRHTAEAAATVARQLPAPPQQLALPTGALYEDAAEERAESHRAEGHDRLGRHIELGAAQCIIYTSGTTGHPKGVLLSYGNHWWGAINSALNLGLHADDRWLACLPLFHIGGLSILLRSVIYGIPVVFPDPPDTSFDPIVVTRAIAQSRATIISVVSAQLQRMLDAGLSGAEATALRCVLLGGGPAPRPLLEECARRAIPVAQTYGLTEACSQVATLAPADALRKLGSAGRPLFATEVRIDSTRIGTAEPERGPGTTQQATSGRDAIDGAGSQEQHAGEILVRGPTVTPGYLAPDEEGHLRRASDADGWLHTGDIGYLDAEGYLYVLDRRTDLIIAGGENVYPAEVEAVLLAHPAVAEAGVFGIPDPVWGKRVAAAVVPRTGSTAGEAVLIAFCRERLAAYKTPVRVELRDALPRNAAGKLLRRELGRAATDSASDATMPGPRASP